MTPTQAIDARRKQPHWIPKASPLLGQLASYAKMPAALLLDHRLDGSHLKVFLALSLHGYGGICEVSQSRIAEILGWYVKGVPDRSRVNRALNGENGLIACGWVVARQNGFESANTYLLCVPELQSVPTLTKRIIDKPEHDWKKLTGMIQQTGDLNWTDPEGHEEFVTQSRVEDDDRCYAEGLERRYPPHVYAHFGLKMSERETFEAV